MQHQQRHRYVAHGKALTESRTGRILVAVDRLTGERVVLKHVHANNVANNGLSHELLREAAVWALVSASPSSTDGCAALLPLRDVFASGGAVVFVSPCADTDLYSLLEAYGRAGLRMPMPEVRAILRQLAAALDTLHRVHGVVHRDVKTANAVVFFEPDKQRQCHGGDGLAPPRAVERVLLADFGLSRFVDHERMTHEVVTRAYRAPELLLGCARYSTSIDMWAFGCVAVDLLAGAGGNAPLFAGAGDLDQLRRIFDVVGSPSPKVQNFWHECHYSSSSDGADSANAASSAAHFSFQPRPAKRGWAATLSRSLPHGADFLERLLCLDASQRMTAAEVLQHPFLAAVDEARANCVEKCAPPSFLVDSSTLLS